VDESLGHQPGGILGLARLIQQHGEAIEYDLIRHGLRLRDLGTPSFDWRDLLVIVKHLGPESATVRAASPDQAGWGLTEQLLAALVDAVQIGNWQRQGRTHSPRPKPIPRPGVKDRTRTIGRGRGTTAAEFDRWRSRKLGGDHG